MVTHITSEQEFETLIQEHDIVFFDFWATWCGPCKAFGPIFEQISEEYPDIAFAKVDIDANPGLATAAEIRSVPTVVVIKNQQVIFNQNGALLASQLRDLVDKARQAVVED